MILTYKVKHLRDLSEELKKAKKVALFALKTKSRSSKNVKHIGLPSSISNQILKKYSSNKVLKRVTSVKLTVPAQGIKFSNNLISISCLKLKLSFDKKIGKINQIELDSKYAFISCTISENIVLQPMSWVGVDLNATGHCCVASDPKTGKVLKLGKKANHIHKKYKNIRKNLQKKKKYKAVKNIRDRESRIVRDLNHKISSKLVKEAKRQNAGIVLEDLKGIRKNKKQAKSFKGTLNSWSFYQLLQFIIYKAKLLGVPVVQIDPRYTSQQCSICGLLGLRNGKQFKCPHCGHVENADVNASFVISLRHQGILQIPADRDAGMGILTMPKRIGRKGLQPRN